MRKSSTNIGILGFIEKLIRKHPLIYIIFRTLIRYTSIFEKDFDGLKIIKFDKKINIIDVGASDGISVKYFLNNLNVNKIICFEPHKQYTRILKKNKNLIVKSYAIGDKIGSRKIFFPRYTLLNFKYDLITYAHYEIKLLKHFLKDFKFRKNLTIQSSNLKIKKINKLNYKIDLIKIDTNGFELNVIRGLINIIKKDKPTLIVEINKDHRKISSLLRKLKYTDYYYSIKKRKFSRRMDINCTNKYFLQNKKLKN
jgi:FkbM family methyltransferase